MIAIHIDVSKQKDAAGRPDVAALNDLLLALRQAIYHTGEVAPEKATLGLELTATAAGSGVLVVHLGEGLWKAARCLIVAVGKDSYVGLRPDCRDSLYRAHQFLTSQGWSLSLRDAGGGGTAPADVAFCPKARLRPWRPLRAADRGLRWLFRYPLLMAQVPLLMLASWGVIGADLGVEGLFWHEDVVYQFFVGLSSGWLLGVVFFIRYLLDRARDAAEPHEPNWLDDKRFFSLFPSESSDAVDRMGRFVLVCLLVSFALLVLPKFALPSFWEDGREGMRRFAHARSYFAPLVAGLLTSLLCARALYWFDEKAGIRKKIKNHPWFRVQSGMRDGRVPPDDWPLHAVAIYLALASVATLAAFGAAVYFVSGWVTPVALFALILIAVDAAGGYLYFHLRRFRIVAVLLVAYLVAANSSLLVPYKYGFPNLGPPEPVAIGVSDDGHHEHYLETLAANKGEYDALGLIDSETPLVAMRERWQRKHPGTKPRLVLVATSGGGIRAAVWTAVVLEGLEEKIPNFRSHVRLMTGASGGMQGAALYAADADRPEGPYEFDPNTGLGAHSGVLARDSLTPTAQGMLLRDFLWAPFSLRPVASDRGRTLERAWDANSAEWLGKRRPTYEDGRRPFRRRLGDLRALERTGERPSLIFSPMMVEDARRLLVSNLKLSDLTQSSGDQRSTSFDDPGVRPLALSAAEFWALFPGATDFEVGTAARMSATFPVLSPIVSLPTTPPRRLVDAGYYDNYGVDLAAMWLHRNQVAVRENTSGVVLVQIRAYRLGYSGRHFRDDDPLTKDDEGHEDAGGAAVTGKSPPQKALPRGVVGGDPLLEAAGVASGPAEAILNARGRSAYYRNSQLIDLLQGSFNVKGREDFFTTTAFELDNDSPLNWYLPTEEARQIVRGFYKEIDRKEMRRWIRVRVNSLRAWFGEGGVTGRPGG